MYFDFVSCRISIKGAQIFEIGQEFHAIEGFFDGFGVRLPRVKFGFDGKFAKFIKDRFDGRENVKDVLGVRRRIKGDKAFEKFEFGTFKFGKIDKGD